MKGETPDKQLKKHLKGINYAVSLVGVIITIYGNLDVDNSRMFGISWWITPKKLFFITNFTLLLSTLSFILTGVTYTMNLSSRAKKLSSCLLSCLVSAELIIFCTFWPIFWCNPKLVFPSRSLNGVHRIGLFSNMCAHALPVLILFASYVLDETSSPPSIIGLSVYTVCITIVSGIFRFTHGRWRYMALSLLPSAALLVFPFFVLFIGWIASCWVYKMKLKAKRSGIYNTFVKKSYMLRFY